MYRCRSLLLLLRETRTVLTTPTQVARCGFLNCHQFSQRHYTDSVSVANLKNDVEKQDNGSTEQGSETKKLSVDEGKKKHKTKVKKETKKTEGEPNVSNEGGKKEKASKDEKIEVKEIVLEKKQEASSRKHLSNPAIVANIIDDEEKQGNGSSEQVSEAKMFSFESLYDDEKKVTVDVEQDQEIGESQAEQKLESIEVESDVSQADMTTSRLDGIIHDLEEGNKHAVEEGNKHDVEEGNKHDVEEGNKHDVEEEQHETKITDASNDDTIGKEKMEDMENDKQNQVENKPIFNQMANEIDYRRMKNEIFTMDNPETILEYLENCFEGQLYSIDKFKLFLCAVSRMKLMEPVALSPNIVDHMNDALEKDSLISRIEFSVLQKISYYVIRSSSLDNKLTSTLLHEMSWRLRRSSMQETLDVLECVKLRATTENRCEVHQLAKERLKDIIGTVSTPAEVLSLMYNLKNTDAQQRVEQEALAMLHTMDCYETYKLLDILVKNKSLNFTLMHQARQHLFSRPITLNFPQLRNLLFIFSSLQVNNPSELKEISINILEFLESKFIPISNSHLVAVLLSCSKLGWNYTRLSNKIIDELNNDEELFKTESDKVLTNLLVSLCHLNLETYKDFGRKIADHLISNNNIAKNTQLEIVSSLACLKIAEKNDVLQVLQPDVYQPILDSLRDSPKFFQDNVKCKLLSLYGYLREDLNESTEDIDKIACKWRDQLQAEMKTEPVTNFGKAVSQVMTSVAPLHKYTNLNVVSRYGYTIDFELFVDERLKSVRLEDSKGMQRVWIKLLPKNAFVYEDGEVKPSSKTAMMMRHLQNEKDTAVAYVKFHKWNELKKKNDHLLQLESLVRKAVSNYRETLDAGKSDDIEELGAGKSEDKEAINAGKSADIEELGAGKSDEKEAINAGKKAEMDDLDDGKSSGKV